MAGSILARRLSSRRSIPNTSSTLGLILLIDRRSLGLAGGIALCPDWNESCYERNSKEYRPSTYAAYDPKHAKQYRYHPSWHEVRDAGKYERLADFAEALPRIRARVEADLKVRGIPRRKVLALVVKLLQDTSIRIGNDEYRREKKLA